MMRIFVSKNVALLFLVIISTMDASRIFYLPLPKMRPPHHELKPLPILQELTKRLYGQKLISDEFIPLSAMERNMYEEEEQANENALDELASLDRGTRNPTGAKQNDNTGTAIDNSPDVNDNNVIDEPLFGVSETSRTARLQSNGALASTERSKRRNDILFLVIVGTCSLVGILGLIAAAIFWYKIQKRAETALDSEYPSYGVTGPGSSGSKISPSATISDRKLAQSAQMFHYQQQRQQMMAQEKAHLDAKPVHSDDSDDEAPNGGDYTVYECPGLAPTGEMEVRNPLFAEPDSSLNSTTSTSHPATNNHYPQPTTSTPSSSPPKEKSLS